MSNKIKTYIREKIEPKERRKNSKNNDKDIRTRNVMTSNKVVIKERRAIERGANNRRLINPVINDRIRLE